MTNELITAVLFDWDFTLAYTLSQHTTYDERTTTMFQRAGVACTLQEIQQARATQEAEIQKGVVNVPTHPQRKEDFYLLYRDLLRRIGIKNATDELVHEIYSEYARLPTYLYDDVLPALQKLQDCGFCLGILSNHTTAVRVAMEQLVGQYISTEHITISEEVGMHKPNPQIYQLAAKKINVLPERCIYVGDNLVVDAIGAVEHGGFAGGVWVNRKQIQPTHDFPIGVAQVSNLTEVVDLYEYDCAATQII